MALTAPFFSSSISTFYPFSRSRTTKSNSNRQICVKVFAIRREAQNQEFSGRLVDDNLIVLRKRIHERKMMERNYEPPTEWMNWEKQFYTSYDSIICEGMGLLQSYLMETRPSLALGMVALITLSVPTSTALVMFNLLELSKCVVSGIHLS